MADDATPIRIEPLSRDGLPTLLALIRELAEYERLGNEVSATEQDLRESLFGERSVAEALLAHAGNEAVGMAVYFHNYSTFLGRHGLYLEDLFVLPQWRGRGLGRKLLARVARIAVERGCGRLEWSVLDWNEPALRFYQGIGARAMEQWLPHRLSGEALHRFAASDQENDR